MIALSSEKYWDTDSYDPKDLQKEHEAGFDAYLTGFGKSTCWSYFKFLFECLQQYLREY